LRKQRKSADIVPPTSSSSSSSGLTSGSSSSGHRGSVVVGSGGSDPSLPTRFDLFFGFPRKSLWEGVVPQSQQQQQQQHSSGKKDFTVVTLRDVGVIGNTALVVELLASNRIP
jgi:hypothetical protein